LVALFYRTFTGIEPARFISVILRVTPSRRSIDVFLMEELVMFGTMKCALASRKYSLAHSLMLTPIVEVKFPSNLSSRLASLS